MFYLKKLEFHCLPYIAKDPFLFFFFVRHFSFKSYNQFYLSMQIKGSRFEDPLY